MSTDITFEYMKDIYLDSYEQLVADVDSARSRMLSANRELLNMTPERIDLEDEKDIPDGLVEIKYEGMSFKGFFHYKESNRLYVFLNGAKGSGPEIRYSRWSYYPFVDGSVLNIADPMFDRYSDLKLGWYYGDADVNYRLIVAGLVKKVALKMKIKEEDIVLIGSSGGGTAIIEIASYIKGSKAVAINPQIVLAEFFYATNFTEITGINLNEDKKWHRHNAIYYLQNNRDTAYILIINLRSRIDVLQLMNICEEKQIRVKYGLNVFDNLIIWIYDGDLGKYKSEHSTQEFYCIWFVIENLLRCADNKKYLEENEALYCIVNEFWSEHWTQELKWRDRVSNVLDTMAAINKKKEVAIWGAGYFATKLSESLLDISGENLFKISCVLDNSLQKRGKEFWGLPIKHPSDIEDWKDLFVIITSERYDYEIRKQLDELDLVYGRDYISYRDLYV